MAEDLSRFIGDPTDQPAPDSTVTPELLTKLDNLIRSHPVLSAMRARIGELEQKLEDGFATLAGLVTPAEIHVRPQDPDELGEVPPTDEAPATT
jgi:hypothetical protein